MHFICATDARADRTVRVQTSGRTPTEAEVHHAHQGFGLGFGNHHVVDMIPEDQRPRPFISDRT